MPKSKLFQKRWLKKQQKRRAEDHAVLIAELQAKATGVTDKEDLRTVREKARRNHRIEVFKRKWRAFHFEMRVNEMQSDSDAFSCAREMGIDTEATFLRADERWNDVMAQLPDSPSDAQAISLARKAGINTWATLLPQ